MSATIMRVFDMVRGDSLNPKNQMLGDRALEIYHEELVRQDEQYKELVSLREQLASVKGALQTLSGLIYPDCL